MAINFIPYEELFAHSYQLTYITTRGHIYVGPYTYNVFKEYTATERQKAYQDCAKWLNWQISEIQEEWELCMYMYQWIIKGPSPFPYEQYTLSEEITMPIICEPELIPIDVNNYIGSIKCVITVDAEHIYTVTMDSVDLSTPAKRALIPDIIWNKLLAKHQAQLDLEALQPIIDSLLIDLKTNIEGRVI